MQIFQHQFLTVVWFGGIREIDILEHFSLVHLNYECAVKAFIALTFGMKCYVGEYQLKYVNSIFYLCCNFAYAECTCAHNLSVFK